MLNILYLGHGKSKDNSLLFYVLILFQTPLGCPPEQISRLKQRQWGEQRIHVGHFPKCPVGDNKGHKIKHQLQESP